MPITQERYNQLNKKFMHDTVTHEEALEMIDFHENDVVQQLIKNIMLNWSYDGVWKTYTAPNLEISNDQYKFLLELKRKNSFISLDNLESHNAVTGWGRLEIILLCIIKQCTLKNGKIYPLNRYKGYEFNMKPVPTWCWGEIRYMRRVFRRAGLVRDFVIEEYEDQNTHECTGELFLNDEKVENLSEIGIEPELYVKNSQEYFDRVIPQIQKFYGFNKACDTFSVYHNLK